MPKYIAIFGQGTLAEVTDWARVVNSFFSLIAVADCGNHSRGEWVPECPQISSLIL
jgi:hypothetical protein